MVIVIVVVVIVVVIIIVVVVVVVIVVSLSLLHERSVTYHCQISCVYVIFHMAFPIIRCHNSSELEMNI